MARLTFGDIPGYPEGSHFESYAALNKVGVHRPSVKGIGGRSAEGADSIVLNGGYKDDRDNWNVVLYTGEGGQDQSRNQVRDQDPSSSGNAALRRNLEMSLPVRVIRGYKGDRRWSPALGYRYDGLYRVTNVEWVRSSDGPYVLRYTLEKVPAATV